KAARSVRVVRIGRAQRARGGRAAQCAGWHGGLAGATRARAHSQEPWDSRCSMSELGRWSEEGATADEIALLEASRRERPSAGAQASVLRALGVAAAATTIGTSAAATAATKSGLTSLSKIVIVSLVGGGVVAGGLAVRADRYGAHHEMRVAPA